MPDFSSETNLSYLLLGMGVILVLVFAFALMSRRGLLRSIEHQRQTIRSMEKDMVKMANQLVEMRSVVVGLGHKLTDQDRLSEHLAERIVELENVDSESRLYSRASKMVQLGAGLNELIEECELPKAEAELMMTLQSKMAEQAKRSRQPASGAKRTHPSKRA